MDDDPEEPLSPVVPDVLPDEVPLPVTPAPETLVSAEASVVGGTGGAVSTT